MAESVKAETLATLQTIVAMTRAYDAGVDFAYDELSVKDLLQVVTGFTVLASNLAERQAALQGTPKDEYWAQFGLALAANLEAIKDEN